MEPLKHDKGRIYYSMGEVAEMFDVNQSLIRYWEKEFDILKPHKNKKGNRMFTPRDVDNLKLIYHLVKEKGMTLAGARQRLKDNPEGIRKDIQLVDRLLAIKSLLMEIKQELRSENDEIIRDTADPETDADRSLELQTEKEWLGEELTELDELDEEIHELAQEAGISETEAELLLESDEILPLDVPAEELTDMISEGEPMEGPADLGTDYGLEGLSGWPGHSTQENNFTAAHYGTNSKFEELSQQHGINTATNGGYADDPGALFSTDDPLPGNGTVNGDPYSNSDHEGSRGFGEKQERIPSGPSDTGQTGGPANVQHDLFGMPYATVQEGSTSDGELPRGIYEQTLF